MVYRILFITIILLIGNCNQDWENSYKEAARRSIIPEVDLILVPRLYSLMDEKWLIQKVHTTYSIINLKKLVKKYGRDWEDFYKSQKIIYEDGEKIIIETEGTSHYTNYDYDRKIPIIFYGPNFINSGLYLDKIKQQHIVPTLASILKSPLPNGANLNPIQKIIKNNKKPEVILTIVIDQGGHQLYKAHPLSFPNIKRLMEKGAYFPRAEVGHLDAHTVVGHTAIGTGAFPEFHRVVSNDKLYIQGQNNRSPNIQNIKVFRKNVFELENGIISPEELKAETLADVWDLHRSNKPIIISQCYAARASIGMAGHGAYMEKGDKDFVYWLNKKSLNWETNENFFNLPKATVKYNLYNYNLANNKNPWWDAKLGIAKENFQKYFYQAVGTPTQPKLEGELFREVLFEELVQTGLGKDGETDLLYITLKATDAVGHRHGWESEEARFVLEETDRQVGLIWEFLEKYWPGEYILVLTADHGAAPLREFSQGLYLSYNEFISQIQTLLPEEFREKESLVNFVTSSMVSLNHSVLEKYGITEKQVVQKILDIHVNDKKFFIKVFTRKDLGIP